MRVKINGARLRAMRNSPQMVAKLEAIGRQVMERANDDFDATASAKNRAVQREVSNSPTPYDMSTRVGPDRARVFVQTASMPARRHEASVDGSSLLRAMH